MLFCNYPLRRSFVRLGTLAQESESEPRDWSSKVVRCGFLCTSVLNLLSLWFAFKWKSPGHPIVPCGLILNASHHEVCTPSFESFFQSNRALIIRRYQHGSIFMSLSAPTVLIVCVLRVNSMPVFVLHERGLMFLEYSFIRKDFQNKNEHLQFCLSTFGIRCL